MKVIPQNIRLNSIAVAQAAAADAFAVSHSLSVGDVLIVADKEFVPNAENVARGVPSSATVVARGRDELVMHFPVNTKQLSSRVSNVRRALNRTVCVQVFDVQPEVAVPLSGGAS